MRTDAKQQYLDLYDEARQLLFENAAPILNEARDEALAHFREWGFPTTKNEQYKYTDTAACFAPDYGMNLKQTHPHTDPYKEFRCGVPNMHTSLFFVVNDTFFANDENTASLPEGVRVVSFKRAEGEAKAVIEKYHGKLAGNAADGLVAFNTAFCQDGVLVYVPENTVVEKPIQLTNIMKSASDRLAIRRLLVVVGRNAQLKLLVCDHADVGAKYLTSQVTEIHAGENSSIDFYEIEETCDNNIRFANTHIRQERGAQVQANGVTLTNGSTRNTVSVVLAGENAAITLNGMATVDKRQHIDNNTRVEHLVPHCTSNELYKYVLDDNATGAFAGRVKVCHGAQKTISQQTNQNLCLTKEAHMFAQPQLEIYADDVKCGHGATVGQLDENAVFYMQQRGLSKKEAKTLLMFAFVNEVVDRIKLESLKDRLHFLVEKRFRGELNKCGSCSRCKTEK